MERKKHRLLSGDLKLSAEKRNEWGVIAPDGHTTEDALFPGYLWNGNGRIRAGDLITITHETHKWLLRLYVVKVDNASQSIFTRVLESHDWTAVEAIVPDLSEARIEHKGRAAKWCVINGTVPLVQGLGTREEAEQWLRDHGFAPVMDEEAAA